VVAAAAGSVTLIGPPERYAHLGLPIVPDHWQGCGPLGGIATALRHTQAPWNLVLACDMPMVTPTFLSSLLDAAEASGAGCLLPAGPSGRPEPLCAVYHVRCLPAAEAALARGQWKVTAALAGAGLEIRPYPDDAPFRNCNTPEEWSAYITEDAANGHLDDDEQLNWKK
jgi:molybdopterin-guanine dinucleotide biosynthesis protein A